MKHTRTKALYDYWDKVRAGRPAPHRLEIEPSAIGSLLPNIFVLERLEPTSFRFRLAGTHVCAYFAAELRNRQFTSLWPQDEREAMESLLFSVTEDGAGAVAGLEGSEKEGRVASFELLLLPLTTRSGAFDRIIGSINPLNAPYWLGNWPISGLTMRSVRLLWPNGQPDFLLTAEQQGHGPSTGSVHRTSDGPKLTVIDGGRSS